MKVGKVLMDGGWKARERATPVWFVVSFVLLQLSRVCFRLTRDKYNLSEVLNHLGIWERLVARRLLERAVGRSSRALELCGGRRTASLRNLAAALTASGRYLEALPVSLRALESATGSPAVRGDIRARHALVLLRLGMVGSAQTQIDIALEEVIQGWEAERLPHKAIWQSFALMVLAQVHEARGHHDYAVTKARTALHVARQHELPTRTVQAEQLIRALGGTPVGVA